MWTRVVSVQVQPVLLEDVSAMSALELTFAGSPALVQLHHEVSPL